ncbi:hypothetical protein ACFVHB_25360 [Kitasatospora sp. NPDC127111]|uniref:hypothetical protein n=1 Tax=Kitasatospora sp. NPDC127111 TaxID=3345363 RepID=UPI00363CFC9C
MERLLREAMDARATQITAHSLRPADPPSRRLRRLKPVYLAAVPLFGLAAAMAFGVLGFRGDTVADRNDTPPPAATVSVTPSPTPTETPTPTATAGPTATASPSADPDDAEADIPAGAPPTTAATTAAVPAGPATPYTFRGVKFKVPAGWKAVPPASGQTQMCVLSPGAPTGSQPGWTPESCAPYGIVIAVYNTADEADHATWPTAFDLDSDSGFSHQPDCPVWGHPYVPTGPYTKVGAPVRTRDIVAGRAISKTQWQVTCKPGEDFTAQLWGLRTDQVYIAANGLKPEYQAGLVSILDTMDLGGRQAPVARPNQNDIGVGVEGLGAGQSVPNDGSAVEFSVTYRNTSQTNYAAIVPRVYAEPYAGAPVVKGTIERLVGGAWMPLDLATADRPAKGETDRALALAPGQNATVKYRMKLTAQDGAGVMPVTASAAVVPQDAPIVIVGERTIPVRVVAK